MVKCLCRHFIHRANASIKKNTVSMVLDNHKSPFNVDVCQNVVHKVIIGSAPC